MTGRVVLLPALVAWTALAAGAAAGAGEPDWYYLHPDSLFAPGRQACLRATHRQAEPYRLPTNKLFYLEQKYGLCPSQRRTDEWHTASPLADPESLNCRMVGKWGGVRAGA